MFVIEYLAEEEEEVEEREVVEEFRGLRPVVLLASCCFPVPVVVVAVYQTKYVASKMESRQSFRSELN